MTVRVIVDHAHGGVLQGTLHVGDVGILTLGHDELFFSKCLLGDFLMHGALSFIAGKARWNGPLCDILEKWSGRLDEVEIKGGPFG